MELGLFARRTFVLACGLLGTLVLADSARPATEAAPSGVLLYHKVVNGTEQIFTIRADGSGNHQLTYGPTASLNADWSPDGRSIVFEREEPDHAAVSIMNADGTNVRELTPQGLQGTPAFSPDGTSIIYSRDLSPSDNGIWVIAADGQSEPRRLTRNPFMHGGVCGCDGHAKLSPDGKTVAFVRVKRDSELQALFSVRSDGSGLKQRLPYRPDIGIYLDWSPDGKRLALTRGADAAPGQSANVVTVRPDGSGMQPVTRFTGGERNAYVGGYSPDGKWLAIRIDKGLASGLYLVRPNGKDLHRIASSNEPQRGIEWRSGS
jgi:Tol biopolymer transport system component